MERQDLIAPNDYNIVMEMEKYAGTGSRKALIYENEAGETSEITYTELMKNVNRIGNVFADNGLEKGDKILVMIPRSIEVYEVYLAALKSGIVIIPSSEMLKTKDLQYRISHGEAKAVVSNEAFTGQFKDIIEYDQLVKFSVGGPAEDWLFLDELKEDTDEKRQMAATTRDDIAFLPYTSGTTGNPKGVVHTDRKSVV